MDYGPWVHHGCPGDPGEPLYDLAPVLIRAEGDNALPIRPVLKSGDWSQNALAQHAPATPRGIVVKHAANPMSSRLKRGDHHLCMAAGTNHINCRPH